MGLFALILVGATLGAGLVRGVAAGRFDRVLYGLYAGLCLVAVVVLVLGSVSLFAVRVLMAVLALGCVLYIGRSWRARPADARTFKPVGTDFSLFESVCLGAILCANALALLSAMAPVTAWDASVAHIALPSDYARLGQIAFLEGNVYAAYPHLVHTLYSYVFAESGETSTVLLSWLFGALACCAVYDLGRRADGRACGMVAAAIFATSPIFFSQVGTASIDIAFAGLTMAALACLFAWREERRMGWLILAALLAGSSCGVRHTGYLTSALMIAGVVSFSRDVRVRSVATFAGICALAAAPWLLRSAIVVGNPVYPFLRSVFGTDRLPDVQTTALLSHETITRSGVLDFLLFPWRIVMRPDLYDGWTASPGPMVLLLGLPGLVIGGAKARTLGVFSIVGGACFFFFQRFARYLLPFFVPMMVVAAMAGPRLDKLRRPVAALLLVSFGYGLAIGLAMMHFKLPVVIGVELEVIYLERRLERYEAFLWANRNLPDDYAILTLDPRSYYISKPTYQNFEVLRLLQDMPVDEQVAWLQARNIRFVFYPEAYVRESPVYVERGFAALLDTWRADADHFTLVQAFDLQRPGRDDTERVEIYEVVWVGDGEVTIDVGP